MAASAPDTESVPKSAVPLADLSALDRALKADEAALTKCLRGLRPADVGRDLTRRTVHAGERIVLASDERRAAAMLRATHPAVAAQIIAMLPPEKAGRILTQIPTEPRTTMLGLLEPRDRVRLEEGLSPIDRAFHDRTLELPDVAVARLMSPHFWSVEIDATVEAGARRASRGCGPDRGRSQPLRDRGRQARGRARAP